MTQIFDKGIIFPPEILDITDDEIKASVQAAISNIAGLALGANIPSVASVPHLLVNAFKDLLHVSIATEITFDESAKIKELLDNPELLAAAQASATTSAPKAEAKVEEKEEEKEESDDDMGFGLFD